MSDFHHTSVRINNTVKRVTSDTKSIANNTTNTNPITNTNTNTNTKPISVKKSTNNTTTTNNIPVSSKKFNRTSFNHYHSTNGSTTPAVPLSTSPSQVYINREPPMIHNKLYCDTFSTSKKSNSTNASSVVLSKLNNHDDLRSVKSHTELAETANGVRMLAKNLAKATIQLDVRAIMIVTKARDNSLIYLTREIVEWLFTRERDIIVYVDNKLNTSKRFDASSIIESYPKANQLLKYWDKKFASKNPELFDLVITLGGDGTVLYVSNLFQRVVPPVISFALGSLGFLTNFNFNQFREKMNTVVDSGVRAYLRMRFTCRVHRADGKLVCEQQVLNELVVDRGPSPYVTQLELYGDGSLLTVAQADGLIIATPTGSTAYSLSAGGSLVHPGVSAISVTPICPHTLSFRPILLPDGMFLKVKVPMQSRSTAWASFDGKVRTELRKGDYVTIQASPFPFPTVISSKTEYIDSVSRNLHWNVREQQKPFSHIMPRSGDGRLRNSSRNSSDTSRNNSQLSINLENLHIGDGDDGHQEDFDINYSENENIETIDNSLTPSEEEEELEEFEIDDDDEEENDSPYIPKPGEGINTPPHYEGEEDRRECFAHPHAKITLHGSSSGSTSNSNSNSNSNSITRTNTSTSSSHVGISPVNKDISSVSTCTSTSGTAFSTGGCSTSGSDS
ncbi:ATP-NAD kinase-like domain-containing protein [Scheffersomyces amazonensis]|uniref:ATP-NAD kinase-like domain-containing protein n=1 Tax=Scheffersomyces amazonensis TaxID=1078765 RepID=UPI00315D0CFC